MKKLQLYVLCAILTALPALGSKPSRYLTDTPSSISFGSVNIGSTATQQITVQSTGLRSLSIQSVVTGAPFSVSGPTLPLALAPGQTAVFSVSFSPATSGNFSGTLTFTSNASDSTLTVPLSGSGIASSSATLTVSPNSIAFGSVLIGQSAVSVVALSNGSGSNLTVSNASTSNPDFNVTGCPAFPITLAPSQTVNCAITFTPTDGTAITGTASFGSSATNSPTVISSSGSGQHNVALGWTPSSGASSYNVYRDSVLLGSAGTASTYLDSQVASGSAHTYYVTALTSAGESSPSNTVTITVPSP